MSDNTPRCKWVEFKEGLHVSANKTILLLNPAIPKVDIAVIDISETDERGDLYDYYLENKLNWEDYTHYCYACFPINGGYELTVKYKDSIESNVDK